MSKSINLSPVSYKNWLRVVFDRPVPPLDENGLRPISQTWFCQEEVSFHLSSESRFVTHVTRLCREFKDVVNSYALEQINQGIWFLFAADIQFGNILADRSISVEKRIECVRAMFFVYADFVAVSEIEEMENCFDMWWDMLAKDFWNTHLWRLKGDEIMQQMELTEELSPEEIEWNEKTVKILSRLKPDEDAEKALHAHGLSFNDFPVELPTQSMLEIDIKFEDLETGEQQVMDAMLDTLTKILYLEEDRCTAYALHGLNHLNHPRRPQTVQQFIDKWSHEWDEETISWVEKCRDGQAM